MPPHVNSKASLWPITGYPVMLDYSLQEQPLSLIPEGGTYNEIQVRCITCRANTESDPNALRSLYLFDGNPRHVWKKKMFSAFFSLSLALFLYLGLF